MRYSIVMEARVNIVKMSILANLIYRINTIPASYFVDINKPILKYVQKDKRHRVASTIQKNKVRKLTLHANFETYYKAMV